MARSWTRRAALAALLAASLLGLPGAAAAQQTVTLEGTVIGAGGVPKGLARMEFSGPSQRVAVTDAQGAFRLPDMRPGDYNVTIRQGGNYQRLPVRVSGGTVLLRVDW